MRDKIRQFEKLEDEFNDAQARLEEANDLLPSAVDDFDQKHKEQFIVGRIGPEPEKPSGFSAMLFRSKWEDYLLSLADYQFEYAEAEKAYNQDYAEEGKKLELQEREKIDTAVEDAGYHYDYVQAAYEAAKNALEADDTLSERLKKPDIVDALIEYLRDCRADSLKEAVNLYYEELHRARMEELLKEQIRLTSEVMGKAELAVEIAQAAEVKAQEALSVAIHADKRADTAQFTADYVYFTKE